MYCVNLNEFYWLCHSGLVKHCPLLDLWLSCRCYKHKLFNLCKNEQKVRKSPTALWEKNQQHHISQSHIFFEIEEQLLCLLWFQQVYPGNRCILATGVPWSGNIAEDGGGQGESALTSTPLTTISQPWMYVLPLFFLFLLPTGHRRLSPEAWNKKGLRCLSTQPCHRVRKAFTFLKYMYIFNLQRKNFQRLFRRFVLC